MRLLISFWSVCVACCVVLFIVGGSFRDWKEETGNTRSISECRFLSGQHTNHLVCGRELFCTSGHCQVSDSDLIRHKGLPIPAEPCTWSLCSMGNATIKNHPIAQTTRLREPRLMELGHWLMLAQQKRSSSFAKTVLAACWRN